MAVKKSVSQIALEIQSMLPIQAAERETGVSKEILRMWERRYNFPLPSRDLQGDRIYPPEQINKLRILRRLIDSGYRPGKIISLGMDELESLVRSKYTSHTEYSKDLEIELLEVLKSKNHHMVREYLSHQLVKIGLQSFVLDFLQHSNTIVGDAWMHGFIEVHEEHLYTEQVHSIIKAAISNLKSSTLAPHIMLTTPPEESHTLGILMTEALLRLDQVDAICFGAKTPVSDIVHAAQKHRMDIVALSFSASYPSSKAIEFLEDLRFRLPHSLEIWAGGGAIKSTRRNVEGVHFFHDLDSIRKAIQEWRKSRDKKP